MLKEKCRGALAAGLHHTGLLGLMRRLAARHDLTFSRGSRLPRLRQRAIPKFGILCYHRVGVEGVPLFSRLDPVLFEEQMAYIRRHYRIVSLGELCRELEDGSPVSPTLCVTFDDGYRDLYRHAYPVLRKYDIPATIYLIGRCIETGEAPWYDRIFVALASLPADEIQVDIGSPRRLILSGQNERFTATWEIVCFLRSISDSERHRWCAAFEQRVNMPPEALMNRFLDWDQVRTMHRGGIFFGSHTMTHPCVSRLDGDELQEEIGESKRLLENRLGGPINDFAYPFGKPSDRSAAAEKFLKNCGYRSAVTTEYGINRPGANRFCLRRMQIGDGRRLSDFAFDLSRMFLEDSEQSLFDDPAKQSAPAVTESADAPVVS
jgi:peptidoglycan/xylan/chitin deacetylase (PgdA/CDA1 family)